MPTKHVTELAEAYLNNQLSPFERQQVEAHLADCPNCARYVFYLKRLDRELNLVMEQALGEPKLPPALRYKVQQKLASPPPWWRRVFLWPIWGQTLNNVGALTAIVLLASGLFVVIRTMLPQASPNSLERLASSHVTPPLLASPTRVQAVVVQVKPTPLPTPVKTSLRETLPPLTKKPVASREDILPTVSPMAQPYLVATSVPSEQLEPRGLMAFAIFNMQLQPPNYQVYLLNLNDNTPQTFALSGVSEPALRYNNEAYQLAFRGWGNPARALFSSDLSAQMPLQLTHFWEDGQPDWSPTENRLIFASQREVDRKWRLYTAWGDGSLETNLRREGQSPTFAPDGERFAFQSCAEQSEQDCGLWQATLENTAASAKLFLPDPSAASPDWSPLNEQIVYMANPDNNWDLYLTDSLGREVQRLTYDAALDGAPTWSPDGQWVAFFSNRGGNWGIWVLHLTSKTLQPVFDFGELEISSTPNRAEWWHEQMSWVE